MPVENYLRPAQKCKTKTSWYNQDAAPSAGSAPGGREDAPRQPPHLLQNLPGQQDDERRARWPEVLSQTFLTRLPESTLSLGQTHLPQASVPWFGLEGQAAWAEIPSSSPSSPSMWPWANYSVSLFLVFLICRMEIILVYSSGSCWSGCRWDETYNTEPALPTVPGRE